MASEEHDRYVPSSKRNYKSPERRNKLDSKKSSDYSVLLYVGRVNSFLGWLILIACVIGAIGSFLLGWDSGGIGGYVCLAYLVISPLIIASGQAISCFVSTESNGKETTILLQEQTILLQKILDKMETTEKG